MSIAGKRAGLNSSRSNLFYEAIRIIKEMREKILKKYLKKSVLRKYGIYRSSFWTGIKDMSPPTKELMKMTLEQKIAHDGHPVLRWNM